MMALAAMAMAGCGQSSAPAETAAAATDAPAEETTASSDETKETSAGAKDALKGVKLKFGTTALFAPFTYYDTDGTTLIGFDIDMMNALKDYLGFELDGDIQVMDYSALTASHMYAQANFPESCIEVHDTITTCYESLEQGKVDACLQDLAGQEDSMDIKLFSKERYKTGKLLLEPAVV